MSIEILPSNLLKKGVVVISWPCSVSWKDLMLLDSGIAGLWDLSVEPSVGMENSVVLYSLYKLCQFKLSGNPNDARKSKFTGTQLKFKDKHAIMTFDAQNTFSSVRKIITLVCQALDPSKTKQLAKKYTQQLGYKFVEDAWTLAVNTINVSACKWAIIGKVKLDVKKIKTLNAVIKAKFLPKKLSTKGNNVEEKNRDDTSNIENIIKCKNAFSTLLLDKYLESQKIDSIVTPYGVKPYVGNSKLDTVVAKINHASKIAKFVEQKIIKINTKKNPKLVLDALRALAVQDGYFSVQALKEIKIDSVSMVSAIKGCL